jgi:hypothetical protein
MYLRTQWTAAAWINGLGGHRIEAQVELGTQVRDVENDGEEGAVGPTLAKLVHLWSVDGCERIA